MTRFRVLVAAGLATALTIGTLAAPAAAATTKGRIIVANGFYGAKTELCLGGKEIRSTFKYGQYAVIKQTPGNKLIRLKKQAAGTCKGRLLAKKWVNLQVGDDLTLVFSRKDPRATLFPTYPYNGDMVLRNGSDLGVVEFHYTQADDGTLWFKSLTSTEYEKGDWGWGYSGSGYTVFWAKRVADGRIPAAPFTVDPPDGFRDDAILVGSKFFNARWIHMVVPNFGYNSAP